MDLIRVCGEDIGRLRSLAHKYPEIAFLAVTGSVASKGLSTVPERSYPFETHGMKMGCVEIQNMFGIGIPFLSWMPDFERGLKEPESTRKSNFAYHIIVVSTAIKRCLT